MNVPFRIVRLWLFPDKISKVHVWGTMPMKFDQEIASILSWKTSLPKSFLKLKFIIFDNLLFYQHCWSINHNFSLFQYFQQKYSRHMPCPSISPKRFWTCPNYFGSIQNVLYCTKKQFFTTEFHFLNHVQNILAFPKWNSILKHQLGIQKFRTQDWVKVEVSKYRLSDGAKVLFQLHCNTG